MELIKSLPHLYFLSLFAFIVVVPRTPLDAPCSVGGSLSRPFRTSVMIALGLRYLRQLGRAILGQSEKWVYLVMIESPILSWISLITPYVMLRFMSGIVNIPDPGRSLQVWLQAVSALTVLGIFLSQIVSKHFIGLVRCAEALSTIPVIDTCRKYNLLTTPTGPHRGRGLVLVQAVIVVELHFRYWMILAGIGDFFNTQRDDTLEPTEPMFQVLMYALRNNTTSLAPLIRVLVHSFLINMFDEMSQQQTQSSLTPETAMSLT